MREEFIKNHFEMDGVKVFDFGEEYVFSLENEEGKNIEYHLTKPLKNLDVLREYIKSKKDQENKS